MPTSISSSCQTCPKERRYPTYRMDLNIDWGLVNTGDITQIGDSTPTIEFNNVQFELVTFMKDFVGPTVQRMAQAFAPLDPILDFLANEPPVIAQFLGIKNWFDLIIIFGGINETVEFTDAAVLIRELADDIPDLTGEAWIDLGSFTVDGDVARGATMGDLILAGNAVPFLPAGAGDIESAHDFQEHLRSEPEGSVLGQIFELSEDSNASGHEAAEFFLKTRELPGNPDTGIFGIGGIAGRPVVGLFTDEPVEPFYYPILGDITPNGEDDATAPDANNPFRLLLGETRFDGDEEPSLLLEYRMPDFEFELLHVQPLTIFGIVKKFVSGLGKKTESEVGKDDADNPADPDNPTNPPDADDTNKKKDEKKNEFGKFLEKGVDFVMTFIINADYGFVVDTKGLEDFRKTRDAQNLVNGFYIDDLDGIDTGLTDFGDVSFGGLNADEGLTFFGFPADQDQVEYLLGVGAEASASVGIGFGSGDQFLGVQIEVGLEALALGGVTFNLADTDSDGKVRASEFDFNRQASPGNAFNLGGKVDAIINVFATLNIAIPNPFPDITLIEAEINVLTLPIFDFDVPNNPVARPVLAEKIGGILHLNIGTRAGDRIDDPDLPGAELFTTDRDEFFAIGAGVNDNEVIVSAFGITQTFSDVTSIIANAGQGDDTIIISQDVVVDVTLNGGTGDDRLIAGGGRAILKGDDGNDYLQGGAANDSLEGGDGDDNLRGGDGSDTLDGNAGDDNLRGDDGNDILSGNEGNDNLQGGRGNDTLFGDSGVDQLFGESGDDTLHGGNDNDILSGGVGADMVFGDAGDDTIDGDDGADTLDGGAGNDSIRGGLGNDTIFGGDGEDNIEGGLNNDTIFGGEDDDDIEGNEGSDTIFGDGGDDKIFAFNSSQGGTIQTFDTIDGGTGNDAIFASNFADTIFGNAGDDTIYALAGDDFIDAGTGDDEVFAGTGADWVIGGFGADILHGEEGSDVIWGGFAFEDLTASDFDLTNPDNFKEPLDFNQTEDQYPTGYTPLPITPVVLQDQNVEGRLNDGRDKLFGGDDTDFLFGGDDTDTIYGQAGNDYIDAGAGDDMNVHGNQGDDVVRGGSGRDALHGDAGIDQLYGDGGDDNLFGDAGIDVDLGNGQFEHVLLGQRLFGGSGRDNLYAYAPTTDVAIESQLDGDQLFGGSGGDFLFGNIRREVLVGETGNDFIAGDLVRGKRYLDNELADIEGADDLIIGDSGEDQLLGGGGDDTIWGGGDSDWLEGQNGNDMLLGGSGIDIIVLDSSPSFDELGDVIDGHLGNRVAGDVADDNATDILLIEGTIANDTILLSNGPDDKLKVDYNGREILADWRAPDGTPLVEQFRISGLLGDDTIGFCAWRKRAGHQRSDCTQQRLCRRARRRYR